MKRTDALEAMKVAVEALAEDFRKLPLSVSIETDYLTSKMLPANDINKAKFISVSIVLGNGSKKSDCEFCLTLGSEIFCGRVKKEQLEMSIKQYQAQVKAALTRLAQAHDVEAELRCMIKECEKEAESIRAQVISDIKKRRFTSVLTVAAVIIAVSAIVITTIYA